FSAIDDGGEALDHAQCQRIFDLLAENEGVSELPSTMTAKIDEITARLRQATLEEMGTRNGHWFDVEIEKLEHWAEDRRATLKGELDELDEALKNARKISRTAPTLPEKLERQREVRRLEGK